MPIKIDHLKFLVSSLDESMPYYDALFKLIEFKKLREHVWTDGAGLSLHFAQAQRDLKPYERYGAGLNHIGFSAPSPEFVAHVQSEMKQAGFTVPKIQSFNGAKALFMKDPDGIRFEITYELNSE